MQSCTAQHRRALPSTLHSSSLLGDPSQIKQQLEITEPLIHAAGAELARGCRALLAALRSCRLPPSIEPSLLPRFDPTRRSQPRRGHPHPFIHSSHPFHSTHGTSPRPPHPAAPTAPLPEHSSPARIPGAACPLRPYLSGHGRDGTGARSGAALPPAPSEGSACPG